MKSINFINTVPVGKRKKITQWWNFTILTTTSAILVIAYFQIPHVMQLYSVHKNIRTLQNSSQLLQHNNDHTQLLEQEKKIKLKMAMIDHGKNDIPYAAQIMTQLHATLGTQTPLQSASWDTTTAHINFYCSNPSMTLSITQILQKKNLFGTLAIAAIEADATSNLILVSLKGTLSTV